MKTVWQRIHNWFAANAPAGYGHLRPGASTEQIRAAEREIGLRLPEDVETSLRVHDGQQTQARYGQGLIGGEGWRLLPLEEMVEVWGYWSKAEPQDRWYVPIADLGTGDFVFVNLDPTAKLPGELRIQRRDTPESHPFWTSFHDWLEEFADELEGGVFAYCEVENSVMLVDEMDLG
jgi:cell wall assembly regulator SMI1